MNFIRTLLKSFFGRKTTIYLSIIKKSISYKINRLLRNKIPKFNSNYIILGNKRSNVFFGYYDVSPFNSSGDKILANSFSGKGSLDIGFFSKNNEFNKLCETNAWNYQMGCRLQWANNNENVYFNDFIDNHFKTVEFSISKNKVVNIFNKPIYVQSSDNTYFLSLDFSRLGRLRPGYGYDNKIDDSINQLIPDDNGVWQVNIKTKKLKLLFTIKEIGEFLNLKLGEQYFNHMLISPRSDKFIFFHITNLEKQRIINLLLYDFNKNKYYLLNNSGHISHCNWVDNNSFIAYETDRDLGTGFIIYELSNDNFKKKKINHKLLQNDGHPSYNSKEKSFLIDTYPDKYGDQTLMKYIIDLDQIEIISKEFLPAKYYSEFRCDLHPRFSPNFDKICVDTVLNGVRVMKVFLN